MSTSSQLQNEIIVTFADSGVSAAWDSFEGSLLEFAEEHGVEIRYGCRYGDCGTCLTKISSGAVEYLHDTDAKPDPGTCLPCSCRPVSSITLDC